MYISQELRTELVEEDRRFQPMRSYFAIIYKEFKKSGDRTYPADRGTCEVNKSLRKRL